MNSREKILAAIWQAKPALQPLPESIGFQTDYPDLTEQFGTVLQQIGGTFVLVNSLEEIGSYLAQHYDLSRPVMNLVPGLAAGNVSPAPGDAPHQFENVYLVLLRGQLGVAENAAIWVDERNFPLRALPYITLNLAMVIHERELVANLHDAYRQLTIDQGFGAFIAGPSKTADIEQSLVIGAHGAKSMTVFLLKDSET